MRCVGVIAALVLVGFTTASRINKKAQEQGDKPRSPEIASLVQEKAISMHTAVSQHSEVAAEKQSSGFPWLFGGSRDGKVGINMTRQQMLTCMFAVLVIVCAVCYFLARCFLSSGTTYELDASTDNASKDELPFEKTNTKEWSKKTKKDVDSFSTDSMTSQGMKGNRKPHLHNGRLIYEWEQSDTAAKLFLMVPSHFKKCDLEIKITTTRVEVGQKGKPPFLAEDIFGEVNEEGQGSAWRLRSNGELQIYLEKKESSADKEDWPHVLIPSQSMVSETQPDGEVSETQSS